MTQQAQFTINPISLSLPVSSPSADSVASSSSPPVSQHNPRKRPRSNLTAEEKREARAHRNRIAAQNSRDKRKVQFSTLEQRVAELETENRHLRSAMASAQPHLALVPVLADQNRERENQELKERIKVLEQGWANLVRALTAAGQVIPSLGLLPSMTQERTNPTIQLSDDETDRSTPPPFERPASPVGSITKSPSLTFTSTTATSEDSCSSGAPAADGALFDTEVYSNVSTEPSTLQTSQADPQIDAWLQDILHPFPPSPTAASALALPPLDTVSDQEISTEERLIQLENPAFDLVNSSWIPKLEDAEMEQLFSLLPQPLESLTTEFSGDIPWTQTGLGVF